LYIDFFASCSLFPDCGDDEEGNEFPIIEMLAASAKRTGI
jgi:hypothetical protein